MQCRGRYHALAKDERCCCAAKVGSRPSLLWVKSCPDGSEVRLPLCPRKRTQLGHRAMSEKRHERTHAPQVNSGYSIISTACQKCWPIVMLSDHCNAAIRPHLKTNSASSAGSGCASRAVDVRHFTGGRPATAASEGLFRHFGWPKPPAL